MQFPFASHIGNGNWLVTTNSPLTFTVLCEGQVDSHSQTLEVTGPVGVVALDKTCAAHNYKLSLPVHHTQSSEVAWEDPLNEVIRNIRIGNISCWKYWKQEIGNISNIKVPTKLKGIKRLPLQDLIDELNEIDVSPTLGDGGVPDYWYVAVAVLGGLLLGVLAANCNKNSCRKVVRRFRRGRTRSGGDRGSGPPKEEMEMKLRAARINEVRLSPDVPGNQGTGLLRTDATIASAPDADGRSVVGGCQVGQSQTTEYGNLRGSSSTGSHFRGAERDLYNMERPGPDGKPTTDEIRHLYPVLLRELGQQGHADGRGPR